MSRAVKYSHFYAGNSSILDTPENHSVIVNVHGSRFPSFQADLPSQPPSYSWSMRRAQMLEQGRVSGMEIGGVDNFYVETSTIIDIWLENSYMGRKTKFQ